MGGLVGLIDGLLAVARLLVEGRALWRAWTADHPPEGARGAGLPSRPDQAVPVEPGDAGGQGGPGGRPSPRAPAPGSAGAVGLPEAGPAALD